MEDDLRSQFRLIVNPMARVVKKRYLKNNRFWEKYLDKNQYRVSETLEDLACDVREFSDQGVHYLGILGGDGTIHQVMTALINHSPPSYPAVLPLRGGTMNSVANNIGQKDSPEKVLPGFLSSLASGNTPSGIIKYLIRVSESPSAGEGQEEIQRTFYCFSFANGMLVRFFADYYSVPEPGFRQAVSLILKIFAGGTLSTNWSRSFLAPLEMEIRAGNQDVPTGKVNVVVASSLDNPVLWFKPFGAMLNGRPQFHCLVNAMDKKDLIRNLWGLFVGQCEHPLNWVAQINDIEIQSKEGYSLDGELYFLSNPALLRLSVGPGIHFLKG